MSIEETDQPSMAKRVLGDSFANTAMTQMRRQMTEQLEAQSKQQNLGAVVQKAAQESPKKK